MVEPTPSGDTAQRRSWTSLWLSLGVVATGLVLIFTLGTTKPTVPAPPALSPPPGAAAPRPAVAAPIDRPKLSDEAQLDAWARTLAGQTKLVPAVVSAYGRAEMLMRGQSPDCHLSWATLAGLGQVQAAGEGPLPVPKPIWDRWSTRAVNDGRQADPRNVADAAYTAARYLCSTGADLATANGWWQMILGYTQSMRDAEDTLADADTFAAAQVP